MKNTKSAFVLVGLIGMSCLANADYIYKTQITLMPESGVDIKAKVEERLDMLRRTGQSAEVIERNRAGIEKVCEQEAAGLVTEGTTTISSYGDMSYVSMPVPNLSNPGSPGQLVQLYDGVNTYEPIGSNSVGSIYSGRSTFLSSVPDKLLLWRRAEPTKLVGSGVAGSSHFKTSEVAINSDFSLLMKTMYSKNDRIESIDMLFPKDPTGCALTHYAVGAYDEHGIPTNIKITYFDRATSKPRRTDEYWLTDTNDEAPRTVADIFKSGDEVIDMRLGKDLDKQVPYTWEGSLPSLDELKTRLAEKEAVSHPPVMPIALGGLAICGSIARKRRRFGSR